MSDVCADVSDRPSRVATCAQATRPERRGGDDPYEVADTERGVIDTFMLFGSRRRNCPA
jgi:hypothetical protein